MACVLSECLNEGERSDNGSIVFEDAVKFIIRLFEYTDVAELR